jgi:hypothetical protein
MQKQKHANFINVVSHQSTYLMESRTNLKMGFWRGKKWQFLASGIHCRVRIP